MIMGIGPFPRMGMAGAAIATVVFCAVEGALFVYITIKRLPTIKKHVNEGHRVFMDRISN